MPFISISIDICGSTDAKATLRRQSASIKTEATSLYERFQEQVLGVEVSFWAILRSSGLDIQRLYLIKCIGDEVWYTYDLERLCEYEQRAAVARMIEALVALHTKVFAISVDSHEDLSEGSYDPYTFVSIEMPLKITIEVIKDALDVGSLREKYLTPHVAALLSPLGRRAGFIQAGDECFIDLCNRLGIASRVRTSDKVISSIRSDYIGWEIDRFFRLTKAAIERAVLIGPEILSDFKANELIHSYNSDCLSLPGWSKSDVRIKVPVGETSHTDLRNGLILVSGHLPADKQKGVGEGCDIGFVYWKHHIVDMSSLSKTD